ncbi:pectin acetylesterase 5 isoform X2 [Setaria viridis]|uniref:pectin acetylesterase 5 isoform X2 n=1 Tax=Setaria viridis TaxID=4556 RepID=UPI0014937149|nr:pectin acetylesterase 5-like isoform X2 [Setaria viridis]
MTMAIELLLRQRRRGIAVAAAAPLLLILTVATFSCSPVAATASSPELVELTLLAGAREKGAVCLDGSPPGYHLQRGSGSGAHNWLVYLQGGGWCNTTKSCSERKMTEFGSSKFMEAVEFTGILSNRHRENPDFHNWNIVVIRYCDGASFAGDAEGEDLDGTKLFFRGLRIWEAVVDELMAKGLDTAKQALLTGCSAGSLAALLHCDNFRERFPKDVSVKCLSDAGFFIDEKDLSGERSLRSLINGIVHLQNVREALPKGCLANKDPTEIRNALAPNGSYPGQAWSSCKADIRNCSSTQIDVLHGFRKKLVSELKVAEHNRDWGLFIDSCFTHCQTPFRISWISRISPRLGNKTIAEAVGDWYFGRREEVKYIDCEYPCNPTCSSRLPSA